jgi:hypothetical protein
MIPMPLRVLNVSVVKSIIVALCVATYAAGQVLVEAEGFEEVGGWVVDQQFMDQMGSPVLLAHGLGVPVQDAVATVTIPAGTYRVWVRTRDWVATWDAPGAPGRFQVLIDGVPLKTTFGTQEARWHWQDGGTVDIGGGRVKLALRDLTGFNGRCDAILFASDPAFRPPDEGEALADLRARLLGVPQQPVEGGTFDLVVVGGGVAGTCAAVSAARLGLDVALIQNRPVLGGNSSSEVRVWINGGFQLEPYPAIGEIVAEFYTRPQSSPGPAEQFGDDKKQAVADGEPNLSLFMEEHVDEVQVEDGRIVAVVSQHIRTGRRTRYAGRLFVDCTGDATVGVLAGADWEMKPKERMGASNMWLVEETNGPVAFPRIEWGLNLDGKPFPRELNRLGVWFWETGFDLDPMADAEAIRDHNLRAMFSVWDTMKNAEGRYPNHRLSWAAFIAGKRESRRLLGDVILTGQDVLQKRPFPDGCVATTWPIDLHYPDPRYVEAAPENPFISVAKYDRFQPPYLVPYRVLYSRNVPNLFMAGRNVSVTQEALGSVRVMATGGLMGEVVGRAAYLCIKHDTTPRGVYEKHLDEFKELLHHRTRKPTVAPPKELSKIGANIAPEAKVTTSGDRDPAGSPPSLLTDGLADLANNAQRWLSKPGKPVWVEFRWDQPRKITAARILSGYVSGGAVVDPIRDFVLQRHDGSGWLDVAGAHIKGNMQPRWHAIFEPVPASRVRLLVTATPLDIARLWEVELYE